MKQYLLNRISPTERYEDLLVFPRYFEIETVNACNARCPMCTIDDWDRRDGLMDADLFEKIADEIGDHREVVKRVALYRDGEPLLDKKLPAKVAGLKGRGVRKVGISTNAALLNEDKAESLLLAGIDEVLLSIDSLVPQTYEAIRKGLRFDEVLNNCLRFINIRDSLKSDCKIWVRMIRQESNRDEWEWFERFWKSKLSTTDRIDYRNLHNWGSQLVNFKAISHADTEKPCVALWSLMVIFANGDVPRCGVDYNLKHPIGNVRDRNIASIWNEHEALREDHLAGKRESICKGCTVWDAGANSDADRIAA